jgi:hypothetical protein
MSDEKGDVDPEDPRPSDHYLLLLKTNQQSSAQERYDIL